MRSPWVRRPPTVMRKGYSPTILNLQSGNRCLAYKCQPKVRKTLDTTFSIHSKIALRRECRQFQRLLAGLEPPPGFFPTRSRRRELAQRPLRHFAQSSGCLAGHISTGHFACEHGHASHRCKSRLHVHRQVSESLSYLQLVSHHLCHSALSVPRTKTSMRSAPQETAAGSEVRTPPRDSQPLQPPLNHLCHNALSVPRTNTSRRPDDHEHALGPDVSTPPRDSQPLQGDSWFMIVVGFLSRCTIRDTTGDRPL
jgi:hypothetical protein